MAVARTSAQNRTFSAILEIQCLGHVPRPSRQPPSLAYIRTVGGVVAIKLVHGYIYAGLGRRTLSILRQTASWMGDHSPFCG